MSKHFLAGLALAVALGAAQPASASPASDEVAALANDMQAIVGETFDGGFCEEGANFFQDGKKLRVDTTEAEGSNPIKGPVITTCPAQ